MRYVEHALERETRVTPKLHFWPELKSPPQASMNCWQATNQLSTRRLFAAGFTNSSCRRIVALHIFRRKGVYIYRPAIPTVGEFEQFF
jgi:hypothetical protein